MTGILFLAQMGTSISNILHSVVRFMGMETPARCKSKIVGNSVEGEMLFPLGRGEGTLRRPYGRDNI